MTPAWIVLIKLGVTTKISLLLSHMKFICGLFLVFSLFAYEQSYAGCSRIFVVGTNTDAVAKKNSDINLLSTTLLSEIKKRVDCVYTERTLPFTKGIEDLRNNRIDLFAFVMLSPEWEQAGYPINIYSVNRILLVDKKFYKPDWTADDYLKSPKIKFSAISTGMFYLKNEIAKLEAEKRVIYDPFPDTAMELFIHGKVNATLTSPTFYHRYIRQYPLMDMSYAVPDKFHPIKLSLMISKKRVTPAEEKIFTQAIESMRKDGTLKKIILRFVPEEDFKNYYTF